MGFNTCYKYYKSAQRYKENINTMIRKTEDFQNTQMECLESKTTIYRMKNNLETINYLLDTVKK